MAGDIAIIDGSFSQYEGYSCSLGCRLSKYQRPEEVGQAILSGWKNMDSSVSRVSIEEKKTQMTCIAQQLGFESVMELFRKTECITVSEAFTQPFDEYIYVCPTKRSGKGWESIHEGVGIEFICKRKAALIGRFIKRAATMLASHVALEEEIAKRKNVARKEELARRQWTKLIAQDGKSGLANNVASNFSSGQRICHIDSGREGVVVRVAREHNFGQGLVEAELEDGEIIKSMLILPWIEPLEAGLAGDDLGLGSVDELEQTNREDEIQVGDEVVHSVSGRKGIVRRVNKEGEHGMGVIEVKLDDGEVILTSCVAPGLDRLA